MKNRNRARVPALALRYAGCLLMGLSLAAELLLNGAGAALAAPFAGVGELIAQVAPVPGLGTPVPDATGTPAPVAMRSVRSPRSTPTPNATLMKGGPITFSLSGSLSMGESNQARTFGDPASGVTATQTSTATGNGGLLAQIARRTASTTLSLQFPIGVSLSHTTLGDALAGYYTPKYGIQYGVQPLSLLGGIPLGNTLRGFGFVLPVKGGDLTFFQGPTYGAEDEILDLTGLRLRTVKDNTLLEFGADAARAPDGTQAETVMAGAARTNGLLTQGFETAIERVRDPVLGDQSGYAYQYRGDYGGNGLYGSFTLRRNSNDFLSFGNGALSADNFADGSIRTMFGQNSVYADESFDTSGVGESLTQAQRGDLNVSHLFARQNATMQLLFTNQRRESAFGEDWTGGAAAQVGLEAGNMSAVLGTQYERTTLSYGDPSAIITYSSSLQRQLGNYIASATYQNTRETGPSSQLESTGALALTRTFGLTAFTLTATSVHTLSELSDVIQTSPTIAVSRRISPVLTVAVNYGEQITRDRLNPSSNGRSRIFSIQLAAPFAIGSGVVQGRVNPRLPATISGSVVSDVGTQGTLQISTTGVGNGVSNVAVVLDNNQVQRTDLSGHFQFNFVQPGRHTVQIDTSSLPRGVTPDQPVASIQLLGGQAGQINFLVGNYGGVQGHVMGRDESGQLVPIPGVVLSVDKNGAPATTGPDGLYGFGRLQPGTHVVEVQVASLPATVSIPSDMLSQKVQVRNGEIATADFLAGPLGSISGSVVYDPSLAPDHRGGVFNAYVVAEPGDYAAIADEDGSFIMDNMPPGTYTIDVDPETIPDDTGNNAGQQTVSVGPSQHVDGLRFVLARKQKAVVFSFKQAGSADSGPTVSLQESTLPPGGATQMSVDADEKATAVTATAFGQSFDLSYDKTRKAWIGMLDVPLHETAGTRTVTASVKGPQHTTASADLKVDPSEPVATISLTPRRPVLGEYAAVRARFLADVHAGDIIHWFDGQTTKLGRPITGRVFQFTVKISEQPMRGFLLTKQGDVPITVR